MRDFSWFPPSLTLAQEGVLVGTILGDGNLHRRKTTRLRFGHSLKQIPWMLWKANQFPGLFRKLEPRVNNGKFGTSFELTSRSHPVLDPFYELFYRPRKVISAEILARVDQRALAVWWADDGWCQDGQIRLALGGLEHVSYSLAIEWIESKFKVSRVYDLKANAKTVALAPASSYEFVRQTRYYLPPCIHYKFGPRYCANLAV